MSQIDEAPAAVKKKRPVETQATSPGDSPIRQQSEEMHEAALRETPEVSEELKAALREVVRDEFAVTDAWQPREIIKFVVNCPSGQRALVKHLDTMDLLQYDLIEEMDFFSKKLFPSSFDPAGNPSELTPEIETNIWTVLRDPEKRCRFIKLLNRMMTAASVRPKIVDDGVALVDDPREEGSKKLVFGYQVKSIDKQIELFGKPVPKLKEGQCYAGPIDLGDRMAFFSELNKPLGMIEPFRKQQDAVLASVEPVQSVGSPAE